MATEVKSESVDGASNNDNEINNIITCLSCDISLDHDSYFKCNSCVITSNVQHFCKNCILVHLRKGHSIIDNEGVHVPVCEQHKNIAFKFCNDCNVQFCMDCIETHIGHQFVSLQMRNAVIRKKLQADIAHLEKYASPIRKTKLMMEQISAKISRTESQSKVRSQIEQIISGLKENIASDFARAVVEIGSSTSSSEKVDKLLSVDESLREMADMVSTTSSFTASSVNVENFVSRCGDTIEDVGKSCMASHVFLQPFEVTQSLQNIQESLYKKLMDHIKVPKLESMKIHKLPKGRKLLAGSTKNENKFGLIVHNRSMSGKLLNITKSGENKISVASVQLDAKSKVKGGRKSAAINDIRFADIKNAYAWGGVIILILEETTEIFDIETLDNLSCLQTVSASGEYENSGQKYIIYVYGSDRSDYELVIWDTGSKVLTFSSQDLKYLQLPCLKPPVCADLYFEGNILAYSNVDNDVTISYLESKKQVTIEREEHGLFTVDEIHFLGDRLLILFEKESRVIVVLSERVPQANWSVSSVHQLNEDRSFANEFGVGANLPIEKPVLTDTHYCEKEKCCKKGQFVYGSGRQIERKNCCNFEPVDCDEIVFANRYYANFAGCVHSMNSDAVSSAAVSSTSQ